MTNDQVRLNDALKLIGYAIDKFNEISAVDYAVNEPHEMALHAAQYLKDGIEKIFDSN